jgi:processive 1,2-diacylglycerol beta-glucosyltransferase
VGNLRVLVFSATFGAGHLRAAEAVTEAIRIKEPQVEIIHLDFGEVISKTFNTVIKTTYIELIKHTPKLWGKFYYRTSKIAPDSVLQRFLNGLGRQEFVKYINSYQPDLIICTYPTVSGVLAQLRVEKILHVPVATVVTDYAVHSQWIHTGVDLYIVGCKDVYDGMVARGIDSNRIKITGIPVNPKFEYKLNKQETRVKLGLDPKLPTFLVMGGAYGVLGGAKEICKFLSERGEGIQTIVVCGRDTKLFQSLEGIVDKSKNRILLLGYVTNVEELMSAADLIITKAGGLTVSEALTKSLPLLIFRPIPGQEEENASFVDAIGAGKVSNTQEQLHEHLLSVMTVPGELANMASVAAGALPNRSAERAVEYMLELIHSNVITQKIG